MAGPRGIDSIARQRLLPFSIQHITPAFPNGLLVRVGRLQPKCTMISTTIIGAGILLEIPYVVLYSAELPTPSK